jgi:hypothetical protein
MAANLVLEVIAKHGNKPGRGWLERLGLGLFPIASKLGKRADRWNPGQTILSPDSGLRGMQFRAVHRASGHIYPLRVHGILD